MEYVATPTGAPFYYDAMDCAELVGLEALDQLEYDEWLQYEAEDHS